MYDNIWRICNMFVRRDTCERLTWYNDFIQYINNDQDENEGIQSPHEKNKISLLYTMHSLLRPVFVHLRMSYPLKDLNLHLYKTILVFYNTYIIPLSNHTKIEDTSFHQELYATNQYCWVNHFVPGFRAPKVQFTLPSTLTIAGCSVIGGSSLFK